MSTVALAEKSLVARAASRLAVPYSWCCAERFFDPAVPLPPLPPQDKGAFAALFAALPPKYAGIVSAAYVQATDYASTWWPSIEGAFSATALAEWLMHADLSKPYYRDHTAHQVRVAAMGDMLLDLDVGGTTLLDRAVAALSARLSSHTADPVAFARTAWWLTAVFHDCGYAYEWHNHWADRLRHAYSIPVHVDPSTDHPAAGHNELLCENQLYEQTYGANEQSVYRDRRRCLLQLAADAIRSHAKPPAPLRFADCPLQYLLALADELHEGERVRGVPAATKTRTTVWYEPGDITSVKVVCTGRRVDLRFRKLPERTTVQGRPPAKWADKKRATLSSKLVFDAGDLWDLGSVTVT